MKEALMEKAEEDWQEKHFVQLKKGKDTLHTIKDNHIPSFGKGKGLSREKEIPRSNFAIIRRQRQRKRERKGIFQKPNMGRA